MPQTGRAQMWTGYQHDGAEDQADFGGRDGNGVRFRISANQISDGRDKISKEKDEQSNAEGT